MLYLVYAVLSVCCTGVNSWSWHGEIERDDLHQATTIVSVRNTRVFWTALMALTDIRTIWRRSTLFLLPSWCVGLCTYYLHYFVHRWVRAIRTTRVIHSWEGLQLCLSCLQNAWRCLCLCPAERNISPLCYWYMSDASLSPNLFSFEILSLIKMQSSLRIHRLPLHLLRHYVILQVWNIVSNLHTL